MWLFLLPFITLLDSWNSVCNLRPQIRSVSHLFPIIPLSGLESHLELSTESGPGPLQTFWLAGLAKSCSGLNKMLWKIERFTLPSPRKRMKEKKSSFKYSSSPLWNSQVNCYNGRLLVCGFFSPNKEHRWILFFKDKMLIIKDSMWKKSGILLQSATYFCCIWRIFYKSYHISYKIQFFILQMY